MAETTVAKVAARREIAGICCRAGTAEAGAAAPQLSNPRVLPSAGGELYQLVRTLELRKVVDVLEVEHVTAIEPGRRIEVMELCLVRNDVSFVVLIEQIDRLGEGVIRVDSERVAEAPRQLDLQTVVSTARSETREVNRAVALVRKNRVVTLLTVDRIGVLVVKPRGNCSSSSTYTW